MKILVCISKAPDTTSKIAFKDGNTKFEENGVQFIVNPYDEWYALVRAVELTEKLGGTVTVLSVGGTEYEAFLRRGLAIGAHDAARIDTTPTDALHVAKEIANYAKGKGFDLIMFGKETIDYNGSQVGGMTAELLDLPYVSLASKLEIEGAKATLETDIPGGLQVLEATLPMVVSCAKGMAEARIPNMRGISTARTKPYEVIASSVADNTTAVVEYSLPAEKKGCKMIAADNAEELISLLHNEAKVI